MTSGVTDSLTWARGPGIIDRGSQSVSFIEKVCSHLECSLLEVYNKCMSIM